MSKQIKQLQMSALRQVFQDVRDLVLLSATGIDAQADNQMRQGLRKKNIRLQVVKNSLCRRVFDELGVQLADAWTSPTAVAWGGSSVAELSRELEALIKKNNKIRVKAALAEGQVLTFEQALKMPTRPEALARVVSLALSPAQRVISQVLAPGARVASQIDVLAQRTEGQAGTAPS
jgi:large subunit ribosomal protein L10